MGIDPRDRDYDVHHIVFRADMGKRCFRNYHLNSKGNLFPLKVEDHVRLHQIVWENERKG